MIYKNARIVTHEKQINGFIELDDNNNIVRIGEGDISQGIDCKQNIIMPGFIDTHTHGGYGMSFDDFEVSKNFTESFVNYLTNLSKEGVVGFVPTNVSLALPKLKTITAQIEKFLNIKGNYKNYPQMVAWYFEGPFISIEKKGAHDPEVIIPIDEQFLIETKKKLKLPLICAVAPEVEGNLELIKKYQNDYIFALGHSNASYEITSKAFDSGIKRVIHLYNAMSGFSHRDPGVVNAVFDKRYHDNTCIELIADGHHTTNDVINTTHQIVDINNLSVISDCLHAKGLKDGNYHLGTLSITKNGDVFYLEGSNTLAGSGMAYNKIVNNYHKVTNCSLTDIVKVSSYNSAKNLGLDDNYGQLTTNKKANLIMVNDQFEVLLNISNGVKTYER